MDKYDQAQKLALLLDCAESGIKIKAIEDVDDKYKIYKGMYYVLSDGRVWSTNKKKFLTQSDNGNGYLYVKFWHDDQVLNKRVNILVAEAFVEKPEDWEPGWDAAHIDDDPSNNDYRNIQWQSRKQNINTDHWREANKTKIFAPIRCVETGEVFPSLAAAGRAIGKHPYGINNVLNGYQKTCGGYHWERLEKQKLIKCVETGEVFRTLKEAAEAVKGDFSAIAKCVKGERNTHKGYHWEYTNVEAAES